MDSFPCDANNHESWADDELSDQEEFCDHTVDLGFLSNLMSNPTLIRNVALVGHMCHGKTELINTILLNSHNKSENCLFSPYRRGYDRGRISYKLKLASLVLSDSKSKSYLCNIMETPGHVDFSDQMTVALRLADGAVLVVDAVDGVMVNTERAIRHAIQERISIVLVINKVDKLIAELKLTPTDTYFKLNHIIETVNDHIIAASSSAGIAQVVDPTLGNVCFASAKDEWFFTLQSFAKVYVKLYNIDMDANKFASQLWGDFYFDTESETFSQIPLAHGVERSFVQCVLENVYRKYGLVNGNKRIKGIFGAATAFIDMLVNHIPSAKDAAMWKVDHIYTGPKDSAIYKAMRDSDSTGSLMVNVTSLYTHCGFLGRVYSGEIMNGHTVRVMREEKEPPDNDEVMTVREVTKLWVCQACCSIPISKAPPGSLVLIEGVDDAIDKTATLCNLETNEDVYIFRPLQFNTLPLVKIAFSLLNGWSLDDISEGLKSIIRSYPLAILRVEESGICTISGTGELYLKYIMEDVRRINLKVELEVADPVVSFRETVVGSSSMSFIAETPNKRNRIAMVAESLERGLADDIENNIETVDWPTTELANFLQTKYDWDLPAARSIWEFGPDKQGPNILLHDDTLSTEVEKIFLNAVKDYIVKGFQLGTQEGPICHEPIRNVKFKIVDAIIAPDPLDHGTGMRDQIVQTVRRAVHSAFLKATPRLMEPVYYVEIQTPRNHVDVVSRLLDDSRGQVISTEEAGASSSIVKAYLPMIASFGFNEILKEKDAFCLSVFHHWAIVPGDPLDKTIILRPLEPTPIQHLARQFLVDMRHRKGISET